MNTTPLNGRQRSGLRTVRCSRVRPRESTWIVRSVSSAALSPTARAMKTDGHQQRDTPKTSSANAARAGGRRGRARSAAEAARSTRSSPSPRTAAEPPTAAGHGPRHSIGEHGVKARITAERHDPTRAAEQNPANRVPGCRRTSDDQHRERNREQHRAEARQTHELMRQNRQRHSGKISKHERQPPEHERHAATPTGNGPNTDPDAALGFAFTAIPGI